jgi:hypothetical protein
LRVFSNVRVGFGMGMRVGTCVVGLGGGVPVLVLRDFRCPPSYVTFSLLIAELGLPRTRLTEILTRAATPKSSITIGSSRVGVGFRSESCQQRTVGSFQHTSQ